MTINIGQLVLESVRARVGQAVADSDAYFAQVGLDRYPDYIQALAELAERSPSDAISCNAEAGTLIVRELQAQALYVAAVNAQNRTE